VTGKFKNEHDDYVWRETLETGEKGYGSSDGPLGWFGLASLQGWVNNRSQDALEHYGTPWLIVHESNEGFVTVLTYDSEAKRDRRYLEMQQAHDLATAGIADSEAYEAITGYRRTLEWHAGHDGKSLSWSDEAQQITGDEVTAFITAEIENLRIYMETLGRGWQQIGGDFGFTRLRTGMGFGEFAGGIVPDALITATHGWPLPIVSINERGEMEVGS
jgi:hypothetical protein